MLAAGPCEITEYSRNTEYLVNLDLELSAFPYLEYSKIRVGKSQFYTLWFFVWKTCIFGNFLTKYLVLKFSEIAFLEFFIGKLNFLFENFFNIVQACLRSLYGDQRCNQPGT